MSITPGQKLKVLGTVGLLLAFSGAVQPTGESSLAINDIINMAIEQLDLALQQAVIAHVRFPIDDLKFNAQVVLNVLEGRQGPHYDPDSPDPGDGIGVVNYVDQIRLSPEMQSAEDDIKVALENISLFVDKAIAYTLEAMAQTDLEAAQNHMREALAFLSAAKGRESELTPVGGLLVLKARINEQGGSGPQGTGR